MKLPILSGKEVVKILSKFGFRILDQKGSHIIMILEKEKIKRKAAIPNHKEIAKGTLLSLMKQAGVTREEFEKEFK